MAGGLAPARHLQRRLHPHVRAASRGAGPGVRAAPVRPGRGLPWHLPRPLLRVVRGVQAGVRPRGRQLPDPPDAGRVARGGELLLPALEVPGAAAQALRGAPRVRAAGLPPQRGGVLREGRAARSLDLALGDRLGDPGAVGPEARDLRLGRRAPELRDRGRVRHGRRDVRCALAGGPPRHRQGHRAVPRGDLAGAVDGRRRGCAEDRLRPRLPDDRRGKDVEEPRAPACTRSSSSTGSAWTPTATTSCARSRSATTATTRSSR